MEIWPSPSPYFQSSRGRARSSCSFLSFSFFSRSSFSFLMAASRSCFTFMLKKVYERHERYNIVYLWTLTPRTNWMILKNGTQSWFMILIRRTGGTVRLQLTSTGINFWAMVKDSGETTQEICKDVRSKWGTEHHVLPVWQKRSLLWQFLRLHQLTPHR